MADCCLSSPLFSTCRGGQQVNSKPCTECSIVKVPHRLHHSCPSTNAGRRRGAGHHQQAEPGGSGWQREDKEDWSHWPGTQGEAGNGLQLCVKFQGQKELHWRQYVYNFVMPESHHFWTTNISVVFYRVSSPVQTVHQHLGYAIKRSRWSCLCLWSLCTSPHCSCQRCHCT